MTTPTTTYLHRSLATVSQRRVGLGRLTEPGWAFLLLGLGLALCVGYLLVVNDAATTGLSLRGYEQEIAALNEETRQLEIELANLQSFATIERTGRVLELTERASPDFVVAPDEDVAVR